MAKQVTKSNPEKSKGGRPRKQIDWDEFDKLCGLNCTLTEISGWFSCSEDTIERAVQREKEVGFAEYWSQKATKGSIAIRRMQHQIAMDGNVTMLIWLGKNRLGQSDSQKVELAGSGGGPVKTEVNHVFNHAQHVDLYRQFINRRSTVGAGEDGRGTDTADSN